jgi:hypothetical protein
LIKRQKFPIEIDDIHARLVVGTGVVSLRLVYLV